MCSASALIHKNLINLHLAFTPSPSCSMHLQDIAKVNYQLVITSSSLYLEGRVVYLAILLEYYIVRVCSEDDIPE